MNFVLLDGEFRGLILGQGVFGGIEVNGDDYGRVIGGFYSWLIFLFFFIIYVEVKFIEVEVWFCLGDSGGVFVVYQEGVSVNMCKLGVVGDDIIVYWNILVDNGV